MHGTSHHLGLDTHDYGLLDQPITANMEARLQDAGILSTGEMDACPDDAMRSEIQPELERFVESLMNTLMDAQASVPASNDILQQFK